MVNNKILIKINYKSKIIKISFRILLKNNLIYNNSLKKIMIIMDILIFFITKSPHNKLEVILNLHYKQYKIKIL